MHLGTILIVPGTMSECLRYELAPFHSFPHPGAKHLHMTFCCFRPFWGRSRCTSGCSQTEAIVAGRISGNEATGSLSESEELEGSDMGETGADKHNNQLSVAGAAGWWGGRACIWKPKNMTSYLRTLIWRLTILVTWYSWVTPSESLKIWHHIFLCHLLRLYMTPTLY
jgi:hypothetical protein